MTTTINVPAPGVIPACDFKLYGSRIPSHSYYNSPDELHRYLNTLLDPNATVYVGFNDSGKARYGSIGIARPARFDKDRSTWPSVSFTKDQVRSRHMVGGYSVYDFQYEVSVDFEDGHTIKSASTYGDNLYWLEKYTGPTHWIFSRKPKEEVPPVVVKDRLGNELKQGDFIAYVGREPYTSGMGDLYFGFVDKISPKGTVYAKNIKLDDADKVQTIRLTYPERSTKLNKDIIDELMIRRLTF